MWKRIVFMMLALLLGLTACAGNGESRKWDEHPKPVLASEYLTAFGEDVVSDVFADYAEKILIIPWGAVSLPKNFSMEDVAGIYAVFLPSTLTAVENLPQPRYGRVNYIWEGQNEAIEEAVGGSFERDFYECGGAENRGTLYEMWKSIHFQSVEAVCKNEPGEKLQGWYQLCGEWYYMGEDGCPTEHQGWTDIEGKRYYFLNPYWPVQGLHILGDAYYFDSYGELVTDQAVWMDGKEYYCDRFGVVRESDQEGAPGYIRNGFVEENGALYYYTNGEKYIDWLFEEDGKTYYADENGRVLKSQWVEWNGFWYYCGEDGAVQMQESEAEG